MWSLKYFSFVVFCKNLQTSNDPTYRILSSMVRTFYIENDPEIFSAHYIPKVAEKGFKMAFMMTKLAMNDSCEIIVKNKYNFLDQKLV